MRKTLTGQSLPSPEDLAASRELFVQEYGLHFFHRVKAAYPTVNVLMAIHLFIENQTGETPMKI